MSGIPSDGGRHVVPPHELKCVWMTAGVLSFQLCDREYDCENCPVDKAMHTHARREVGPPEPAPGQAATAPPREPGLPADRRYSRGHCWVRPEEAPGGPGVLVRVGLEPGLATALLTPRSVVHTEPGTAVEQGSSHLWVVTAGGTFGVGAPLSGTLREPNATLHERPHLLATRPLDEGWLYTLHVPEGPGPFAELMDAEAARREYDLDRARLHRQLRTALPAKDAAEEAATGSAEMLQRIADALGPQRYFEILRRVFG